MQSDASKQQSHMPKRKLTFIARERFARLLGDPLRQRLAGREVVDLDAIERRRSERSHVVGRFPDKQARAVE